MFDGTGDDYGLFFAGDSGVRNSSIGADATEEDVVCHALSVTTNLMKSEMIGPSTANLGFGYAYEVLWFDRKRTFRYIDDVLYHSVTYELDDSDHYAGSTLDSSFYKCESKDGFALVYIFDPTTRQETRDVICPIGRYADDRADALLRELSDPNRRFPYAAAYYCTFVRFKVPGFTSPPIVSVRPAAYAGALYDTTKKGEFIIRAPSAEWVEWAYKTIRGGESR